MPILVPGIGAQGGDVDAVIRAGASASTSTSTSAPDSSTASQSTGTSATSRRGLVINSSRAILYASDGADFAAAARKVALTTRDAINAAG
jgi:orotidine-5'-phosphate decarboxylase